MFLEDQLGFSPRDKEVLGYTLLKYFMFCTTNIEVSFFLYINEFIV